MSIPSLVASFIVARIKNAVKYHDEKGVATVTKTVATPALFCISGEKEKKEREENDRANIDK